MSTLTGLDTAVDHTAMLEHERQMLRDQLANLDRIHRELAAPLMKRLCEIERSVMPLPVWPGGTVRLTDDMIERLKRLPQTQVPGAKLQP